MLEKSRAGHRERCLDGRILRAAQDKIANKSEIPTQLLPNCNSVHPAEGGMAMQS